MSRRRVAHERLQVVSAPDGWPLWTSPVRPGREHDTTAARADPDLLTQITTWVESTFRATTVDGVTVYDLTR